MLFAADQRGGFIACHSRTHHVALVQEIHESILSLNAPSIRPEDGAFLEHGEFDSFAVCAANGHYRQASVYDGKQVGGEESLGETGCRKTLPPDRFPVPGTQARCRQESVRSRRYAYKPSAPGPVAGCRR